MDKFESTTVKRNQKLAISLLIGALLIGGLLLFLWRYSSVLSGMSQQAVKNPLQQDAISQASIKENYEVAFSGIMAGYLNSDISAPNFATMTTQTKERVLALTVPGVYKDLHLSTVLALSDLESDLAQGDLAKATTKFSELKKIDQELLPDVK